MRENVHAELLGRMPREAFLAKWPPDRRIASDYRTRGSAHRLRIMRVIDDADLRLNGATGEAPAAGRSGEHRGDEFAAATDADLVEYRLEVILNGVFGDVQRGRDNAGRGSA